MPKRALTTTKEFLINAALPTHGGRYTVISHETVIKHTLEELNAAKFQIEHELYRSSQSANVAQGIYHIKHEEDPEIGLVFVWNNSYDKTMRFRCSMGGRHKVSGNIVMAGDLGVWGRKHTGTADTEMLSHIKEQINNAQFLFKSILASRDLMKNIPVTMRQMAGVLGELFIKDDLISTEQLSIVKSQAIKPEFDYNCDRECLWSYYMHIMHSLKRSHPREWFMQQKGIHFFIKDRFLKNTVVLASPVQKIEEFAVAIHEIQTDKTIDHFQKQVSEMKTVMDKIFIDDVTKGESIVRITSAGIEHVNDKSELTTEEQAKIDAAMSNFGIVEPNLKLPDYL